MTTQEKLALDASSGRNFLILYRPVGCAELRLIVNAGLRRFPPRLPHQPIFYPVLHIEYARAIARDWNTQDAASEYAGFVTRFHVSDHWIQRYPVQVVGASRHQELWIPAEDLPEFNAQIAGLIEVIESYDGPRFSGHIDPKTNLPLDLTRNAE